MQANKKASLLKYMLSMLLGLQEPFMTDTFLIKLTQFEKFGR